MGKTSKRNLNLNSNFSVPRVKTHTHIYIYSRRKRERERMLERGFDSKGSSFGHFKMQFSVCWYRETMRNDAWVYDVGAFSSIFERPEPPLGKVTIQTRDAHAGVYIYTYPYSQ